MENMVLQVYELEYPQGVGTKRGRLELRLPAVELKIIFLAALALLGLLAVRRLYTAPRPGQIDDAYGGSAQCKAFLLSPSDPSVPYC